MTLPFDASVSDSPEEVRLWKGFARSVRANVLAEMGSQAIRVCGLVYLARALAAADFGVLRILIAITQLAGIFSTAGIADALIQREQLNEEHEVAAWWTNLGIAASSALLLYAAAPLLGRLMAITALVGPLRLLCVPLFLDGAASISSARLRRRLAFSALTKAEVAAEVAFLSTALVVLFTGFPRWSLAGGLAARLAARGVITWMLERYVPRSAPRPGAIRDLCGFSTAVWGGRLLIILSGNFDYLLIGRLLGSTILGYYAIAWDLLRFIPDRLFYVAGRVTLPTFARLQENDESLRRAYSNFSGLVAQLVFPITAFAAAAAPRLIVTVYGEHWLPAAVPLRLLSFGLSLLGMRLAIGSIYYAKSRPSFDIWLHGLRLVLIALAIYSTASYGLVGVSAAMSIVEATISIVGQVMACRLIRLSAASLLRAWWPGCRVAAACGLAALVADRLATAGGLNAAPILGIMVVPTAAVFLWLQFDAVRGMVGELLSRDAV